METRDAYQQLAAAYGYPHSGTMGMILQAMMDEPSARLLLLLPGAPEEVAKRSGRTVAEVVSVLEKAFEIGLVFRAPAPAGGVRYALISNLIDAVLGDKRINEKGPKFLDLWRKFTRETEERATGDHFSPPSRVVPVEDVLENKSQVLPYESVSAIIRDARVRIVVECACRKRTGRCKTPLELCLMLDNAAEYMLSRGAGRRLSVEEAMAILDEAEELGLVHETGRNAYGIEFICNCCPCCCCFLRAYLRFGSRDKSIRSRYRARLNAELCTECGACVKRCHFGALTDEDGVPAFDPDKCVGCGLCASKCPSGALELICIEPPEFLAQTKGKALFGAVGQTNTLVLPEG